MGTASSHNDEPIGNQITKADIEALFDRQLHSWQLLADNYAALNRVKTKHFTISNAHMLVQFNPARITSSAAKVDAESIKQRRCFLCHENRPAEQDRLPWGNDYNILVNPYPIFPRHLTIASTTHVPQRISHRIADMMQLAALLDDFIIFYNGPRSGASAPDHFHFQAGSKGLMTFDSDLATCGNAQEIINNGNASLNLVDNLARTAFVIYAHDVISGCKLFDTIYETLPVTDDSGEPMLNILCWIEHNRWVIALFPRTRHRPGCYYATGYDNLLISPASVDMGGVFILPLEKDFEKINETDIKQIFNEVCISPATAQEIIKHIK